MATTELSLDPEGAQFLATVFPQYVRNLGTNFPVAGLAFDTALDEAAFWHFTASRYGSGNITCNVDWYADTASSGDVVIEAAIAAITPDTDTQDVETKAFATIQKVTDTHLGTTGQRVHRAVVTISNLDSVANEDDVWLRIRRLGSTDANDTMAGDLILVNVLLTYSDT